VDSRDKLDLDNLTDLNRKIWKKIEEAGLNENFSKITVSSPGIDRSFKYIEQLLKHTGRDIDIKLNDGTKISGTLENILEEEGQICLGTKGRKKEQSESNIKVIDFKIIKESKIKIKF
jgi:ribosome maturation factor RimP